MGRIHPPPQGWRFSAPETYKLVVDMNGHGYGKKYDAQRLLRYAVYGLRNIPPKKLDALDKALKTGKPCKPVALENDLYTCHLCGEDVPLETDGTRIYATTSCEFAKVKYVDFDLNVPSGKLVVGNDFRAGFKMVGDYYINHRKGMYLTTKKYAEIGLAHGFVGNTCPGVYRVDNEHFVIGTTGSRNQSPVKGAKRVAGICTDLWWYSIADYDQFVKHYEREPGEYEEVVKCKPGLYRFRHSLVAKDDYRKATVYAKFRRVGDAVAPNNAKEEFEKLNYTAEEIVGNCLQYYKTLLHPHPGLKVRDEDKSKWAIMAAANQVLVVLGNGADYHPNGWVSDSPDIDRSKAVEIPEFDIPFHWYDFGDYSVLANAAGIGKEMIGHPHNAPLNESFTRLAFNILRNTLKYPETIEYNPFLETERFKASQKWARKIIIVLAKRFPQWVPENCREVIENAKKEKAKS